jgi:acetyltransferase-like isoleucine patch superfamily enzyme
VINRRVIISVAQFIKIGKNVLTAPNVLIMDHNHGYDNIEVPILHQEVYSNGPIEIEDGVGLLIMRLF